MTETKIYVGLNDSTEKRQLLETEKYISVLRPVLILSPGIRAYNRKSCEDILCQRIAAVKSR